MSEFLKNLGMRFDALQTRERKLVILGVPLLLLTATFAVLNPLMQKQRTLAEDLTNLDSNMKWLVEQRAVVDRLNSGCASRDIMEGSNSDKLTKLARRNQLRLGSIEDTSDGYRLSFSGSDANRMLQMTHQIACAGFKIESLLVDSGATGELKGSMEVVSLESKY